MKFRKLFGMLGTIDRRTGKPIVDDVFRDDPLAARLVKAHEELHGSELKNRRKYGTSQLTRPEEEATAWLHVFHYAKQTGGIPHPDQLETKDGRNFCANLERLHTLFLEHGGNSNLNTSIGNLDAMDDALRELKGSILGSEGSESTLERGG